jgi:hypothetical protein
MTDETVSDSCNYIELYESSSSDELDRWFNLFAFYNYVAKPIGPTNAVVTKGQLDAARQPFREALQVIKPSGVWIMARSRSNIRRRSSSSVASDRSTERS